jgi:hypothetical protein
MMLKIHSGTMATMMLACCFTVVFGENFEAIPDGKGQIVFYRSDKTSLHFVHQCFIYQITEAFSETGGKLNPQSTVIFTDVQPYMDFVGSYTPKTFSVVNVDPGTYYYFSPNFNPAAKIPGLYTNFKLPVYSITVRAGERRFCRARIKNFDGVLFNEITDQTIADAYQEIGIKDQAVAAKMKRPKKFDPRTVCSDQQLSADPTASLIKQYESFEKMANLGDRQVSRGNGLLFVGVPLAIAGGTTAAVIGGLNDMIVMVPVGIAIGGSLGATFVLAGINSKNKGKSNQRNGRYNMNEIKIKIEGSCKGLSLNATF